MIADPQTPPTIWWMRRGNRVEVAAEESKAMDFAFRDVGALARARRQGTTLDTERAQQAGRRAAVRPADPQKPDVSTALEALRAVLPATLITLYTTAVLLLQSLTNAAGAGSRAKLQASLSTTHGSGTPELEAALAALSVEPDAYAWARWVFALAFCVLVAVYAYRKAQTVEGQRVLLEPAVATGAFVAWAAASPGTPLATVLNLNQLAVVTILVAFIAAAALWVLSETLLKRKAT